MIREKSDYRPEKKEDWMKKRRRREKNAAAKTRYRIFGLAADATCLCCLIDLVAICYSRERERESSERRRFWLWCEQLRLCFWWWNGSATITLLHLAFFSSLAFCFSSVKKIMLPSKKLQEFVFLDLHI